MKTGKVDRISSRAELLDGFVTIRKELKKVKKSYEKRDVKKLKSSKTIIIGLLTDFCCNRNIYQLVVNKDVYKEHVAAVTEINALIDAINAGADRTLDKISKIYSVFEDEIMDLKMQLMADIDNL